LNAGRNPRGLHCEPKEKGPDVKPAGPEVPSFIGEQRSHSLNLRAQIWFLRRL
jgi:hypothetical protein